jgi:hypothetical protein
MSRDWKGDWGDDAPFDEDEDEDDNLAPLVWSLVKPLELSAPSIRRREQQRSDKQRSPTMMLVILLFIILSLGLRHYQKKPSKTIVVDDENDDKTFTSNNKSTEALLERVEGSLNVCNEISFPPCRTWYYHSNFGHHLLSFSPNSFLVATQLLNFLNKSVLLTIILTIGNLPGTMQMQQSNGTTTSRQEEKVYYLYARLECDL